MIEDRKPKGAIRIFSFSLAFIVILMFFSALNYLENSNINPFILFALSLFALGIGYPDIKRMLELKIKKENKAFTIIASLTAGVSVVGLLFLKDLGLFIWNELYLTIPFFVYFTANFTISYAVEKKFKIKVYWATDGLHYVKA